MGQNLFVNKPGCFSNSCIDFWTVRRYLTDVCTVGFFSGSPGIDEIFHDSKNLGTGLGLLINSLEMIKTKFGVSFVTYYKSVSEDIFVLHIV